MNDIFISYARENREIAQQLAEKLEQCGWSVWWDTRLEAGDIWDQHIETQLEAAKCIVVLWSAVSVEKHWVREEAHQGLKREILVPVLIEDVEPPIGFKLVHAISLIGEPGGTTGPGYRELIDTIASLVQERAISPPEDPSVRKDARRKIGISAVILTALTATYSMYHTLKGGRHQPYTSDDLVGGTFRDCSHCPLMVIIPAGTFTMGETQVFSEDSLEGMTSKDEKPVRQVEVSFDFAVSKFETTREEYAKFLEATGHQQNKGCRVLTNTVFKMNEYTSWRAPGFEQSKRDPVVCVSWRDAKAYVDWLSKETGANYRLLSEAEWEYSIRTGGDATYPFGDNPNDTCKYGNSVDLTSRIMFPFSSAANCNDGHLYTAPVGSFEPNKFGLYDMVGNVIEWVEDCWHENYISAPTNGKAWNAGGDCTQHVIRGGSWASSTIDLRSASRRAMASDAPSTGIGIRVSRTL